jgi:hypothetical protein
MMMLLFLNFVPHAQWLEESREMRKVLPRIWDAIPSIFWNVGTDLMPVVAMVEAQSMLDTRSYDKGRAQ